MMVQVKGPEERILEALLEMRRNGGGQKSLTGYKHDATGTPTSVYAHGPGGVFTYPGLDPQVFSTVLGIEPGIIGALPKFPSLYTNPVYMTITGVLADVGSEAEGVCDPVPTAGLMKQGKLTSVFGRYRRQTRELYLNRMGQRTDPSDPTNLRLMNAYQVNDQFMRPDGVPGLGTSALELEWSKVLFEFGVSINRLLARQIWVGNPSNNAAGEGYKELTGFDILIGTGKVDAETGALLPSLDSDIKNFNYQKVDEFANGTDIVEVLTYLLRYVRSIARKSGLLPAEWAFVMREELFYELSAIWPISYLTTRGNVRDDAWQRGTFSLGDVTDQRDAMRREQYLLIDGMRFDVIFDDGITELTNATSNRLAAGSFASDIYLIPLTVLGGTPVTYMEYFQHDNADIQQVMAMGRMGGQVWVTNGGAWIWNMERTRLCFFAEGKVEPRLVMRTPQLAGRVQNVAYTPLQHTREPFPDQPYFRNGGAVSRSGPSLYSEWSS